uniref:angiotensinogen n=1 Tax=Pristiophorus japonicus TaxID=55135 RepID=UPI00398F057E
MKWIFSLLWMGALLEPSGTIRPYIHPFLLLACNRTGSQEGVGQEDSFLPVLIGDDDTSQANGSEGSWRAGEEEEEEEEAGRPSPGKRRFLIEVQAGLANAWIGDWRPLGEGSGVTVLAPVQLYGSLAALSLGASGRTALTLRHILGFSDDGCVGGAEVGDDRRSRNMHRHIRLLSHAVLAGQAGSLSTGTWMVFRKGLRLRGIFARELRRFYPGTQLRAVDFSRPHAAEDSIGSLIRNATAGGRVGKLVKALSPDTNLVLTNHIHFKGKWKTRSQCHGTEFQDFFNEGGTKVQVAMMTLCGRFQYKIFPQYTQIKLPMSGATYMMLIQPVQPNMMQNIEKNLAANSISKDLQSGNVRLVLPRFEWNGTYDVKEFFRRKQVLDTLGGQANFSRLSSTQRLAPDQVMQSIIFEVTEDGEEPIPAGEFPLSNTTATTEIRIDKPFFFRVYDGTLDVLLFLGRVKKLN